MAIIRIYAGADGASHFEDIEPELQPQGDRSAIAELEFPGSGILVRRFDADRTNDWHHAPGRYAVFTLAAPSISKSATAPCVAWVPATF